MAEWSQSHFLQSLGWATLNSFWQMALLWCFYIAVTSAFKLNANQKYRFSVTAVITGFAWFIFSFIYYYQSGTASAFAFIKQPIHHSNGLFQIILTSASLAYLALLLIPSYRLFRNWQFIKRIKKQGLHKADLNYRLFVRKMAAQIGINRKVLLYVSALVKSPVTFGYLKPVILLPVAALNNLSVTQVEAVLLHELSHIKRYDYLVNLIVSCIHTLLYFNPFVKLFIKNIEAERENCCDELVLQFGYDKVGYASALLTLEKVAAQKQVLAIAATGKSYLLNRIEKIVGMEKKNKGMKFNHLAGLIAALFCILAFNSVLIIKEEKKNRAVLAYENFSNPFSLFYSDELNTDHSTTPVPFQKQHTMLAKAQVSRQDKTVLFYGTVSAADATDARELNEEHTLPEGFTLVAQDEVEASLTNDEKQQVKTTVDATKQLLRSQWPSVEQSIGDAMDANELAIARQQYMSEIEKINWDNMEKSMKAAYESTRLQNLKATIQTALAQARLDSLQRNYDMMVNQFTKAKAEMKSKAEVSCTPLPDCSVDELARAQTQLRKQADSLRAAKTRKIVRL